MANFRSETMALIDVRNEKTVPGLLMVGLRSQGGTTRGQVLTKYRGFGVGEQVMRPSNSITCGCVGHPI